MKETNTTDPVTLAREVLDDAQCLAALPRTATVARTQVMIALADAAPVLADAVVELTAERDAYQEENTRLREQVSRVKALADEFDRESSEHMDRPVHSRSGTRIRTVLS